VMQQVYCAECKFAWYDRYAYVGIGWDEGTIDVPPAETKAVIAVEGGVARLVVKPDGLRIEVRDYDVQGLDEEMLEEDPEGNLFSASEP
jgi:hypothetical protein